MTIKKMDNDIEGQNAPDYRRVLILRDGACSGCADSAAATVVISAPVMAKNTVGDRCQHRNPTVAA